MRICRKVLCNYFYIIFWQKPRGIMSREAPPNLWFFLCYYKRSRRSPRSTRSLFNRHLSFRTVISISPCCVISFAFYPLTTQCLWLIIAFLRCVFPRLHTKYTFLHIFLSRMSDEDNVIIYFYFFPFHRTCLWFTQINFVFNFASLPFTHVSIFRLTKRLIFWIIVFAFQSGVQ